ncbi:MAG: hypothetical protein IJT69_01915 [Clostridia bacterium]|nr:hypothetical protein [Clostridia bacterium]
MRSFFYRKTALIASVILLAVLCVFFACACEGDPVTVDFSLEGEPLAGTTVEATASLTGGTRALKRYADADCVYEVVEGREIATATEGRIRIADTATAGDAFKVALTVRDLRLEKEFVVARSNVRLLQVVAPEECRAGEEITLTARSYPESASENAPTFYVESGEATVEGNVLRVSEDADRGSIVLRARLEGVQSATATIRVTTVQTQSVRWEASTEARALPGGTLLLTAYKYPENSDYELTAVIERGEDLAEYDATTHVLRVKETAPIPSEIVLLARSGKKEERLTVRVAYPDVRAIVAQGGGSVAPGAERTFRYTVEPADADPTTVVISLVEGGDLVEWEGGASFRVRNDAEQGAEVTFLLESADAYTTISFTVERRTLTSLSIDTLDPVAYLQSGAMLTFMHRTEPSDYDGIVNYRATVGADLVTIDGETVTVKEGVGIGRAVIVAESADGTRSNEIEITISGRYTRRVYSSWSRVSLSPAGEKSCVWMVLPNALNAGMMTVIVPYEVEDLVIEGRYDGTDESAYRDLYFYFRNRPERRVTLLNFGTIATQGLGGTVMDLGSAGVTEVRLEGQNLIRADSPYFLDNNGEVTNGVWDVGSYSAYDSLTLLRRSGKYGYRGAAGGNAISGFSLSFVGTGTLVAEAGSGVDGTAGGDGADARYDGSATYVSGAGGDGGHGGDSGAAIYADSVRFEGGFVTAIPGNAGVGAKGGSAGNIEALVGKDVSALLGADGADGKDGVCYPAVRAAKVTGDAFVSSTGRVQSLAVAYTGTLSDAADRLSRYYGVSVHYGNDLYNPYAKKSKPFRYTMETQTDATELMRQMQFLFYSFSAVPRNAWREIELRADQAVAIYLVKTIKSGSGSNILGLTSESNNVWFATFDTDIRGVYYGGYYNIMLHEFIHVFHYNFTARARDAFESALQSKNYGNGYTTAYGSKDHVYGVEADSDETDSCFLSSYSRKTVMEDAAETLSIPATFLSLEPPLTEGVRIREKFDLLTEAFGAEYETLAPFAVGATFFCYPHLFD